MGSLWGNPGKEKKRSYGAARDVRLGFRTLPDVRLRVHNSDTNNLVVFVKAHDLDPLLRHGR